MDTTPLIVIIIEPLHSIEQFELVSLPSRRVGDACHRHIYLFFHAYHHIVHHIYPACLFYRMIYYCILGDHHTDAHSSVYDHHISCLLLEMALQHETALNQSFHRHSDRNIAFEALWKLVSHA
jgi:hypothetical protein